MSAKTIIQPNQPDVLVFENGGGAVKITAFGLVGNDCLKFKRVVQDAQRKTFESGGCAVYAPTPSEIALSAPYQVGNCEPTIHAQRNTIFIAEAGRFLPVLQGDESVGSLLVQVESVPAREFSGAELGVEPCGCPCVSDVWTWTGGKRCYQGQLEYEYISNCGDKEWRFERQVEWWETGVTRCRDFRQQIQEQSDCGELRWVQTDKLCGVSPSLPLIISDDCCNQFVAYIFHPDEPRDPAATVALEDCDGVIYGYAYPTASTGRAHVIKDCDGVIYGYAVNTSENPVSFKPCCNEICDIQEIELNTPTPLIHDIDIINIERGYISIHLPPANGSTVNSLTGIDPDYGFNPNVNTLYPIYKGYNNDVLVGFTPSYPLTDNDRINGLTDWVYVPDDKGYSVTLVSPPPIYPIYDDGWNLTGYSIDRVQSKPVWDDNYTYIVGWTTIPNAPITNIQGSPTTINIGRYDE